MLIRHKFETTTSKWLLRCAPISCDQYVIPLAEHKAGDTWSVREYLDKCCHRNLGCVGQDSVSLGFSQRTFFV